MKKEQLNRVELKGYVGSIRINRVGGQVCATLSLATSYAYSSKDGAHVVETWHSVTAWEGPRISGLLDIKSGDPVHVKGRLRAIRYTSADGAERTMMEVFANELNKVEEEESLDPQESV